MQWTKLLTDSVHYNYTVTDTLMSQLTDADLDWKPQTGTNWMTTAQLLMHLTTACGFCFKGFLTNDWTLPDEYGMTKDEASGESDLLPADKLPTIASVQAARDVNPHSLWGM